MGNIFMWSIPDFQSDKYHCLITHSRLVFDMQFQYWKKIDQKSDDDDDDNDDKI